MQKNNEYGISDKKVCDCRLRKLHEAKTKTSVGAGMRAEWLQAHGGEVRRWW
jgi:hypothetical protein